MHGPMVTFINIVRSCSCIPKAVFLKSQRVPDENTIKACTVELWCIEHPSVAASLRLYSAPQAQGTKCSALQWEGPITSQLFIPSGGEAAACLATRDGREKRLCMSTQESGGQLVCNVWIWPRAYHATNSLNCDRHCNVLCSCKLDDVSSA